jgi:hypothetical protein
MARKLETTLWQLVKAETCPANQTCWRICRPQSACFDESSRFRQSAATLRKCLSTGLRFRTLSARPIGWELFIGISSLQTYLSLDAVTPKFSISV